MRQIKHILYTTDLSKSSIEVFEQTVILAAQTGAAITILHVIEDGSSGSQNRVVHLVDKERYEAIRRENSDKVRTALIGKEKGVPTIQKALQELCEKTNGKVSQFETPVTIVNIEVKYGNAADIITQMAREINCDVVAMGYYKKGSILKALMGSAGKRVMLQSKCPLFLIPIEG